MKYLDDLSEERTALAERLSAITDAAAGEARAYTDTEKSEVDDLNSRIAIIDSRIGDFVDQNEARAKFDSMMSKAAVRRERAEVRDALVETPGDLFAQSSEIRNYRAGTSGVVDVPLLQTRAPVLTNTGNFGKFYEPQTVGYPQDEHRYPFYNLLNKVSVNIGSIQYPVYGQASEAEIVAEGGLKPEATISLDMIERAIPTIAHWIQFSRQFASDLPGLASWVNGELRAGVMDKIESEAVSTVGAVATPAAESDSLLTAIRVAMANIEDSGGRPNVVIANPADVADLDIAAMGATVNGAVANARPIWGLTVVSASSAVAGTATVLDTRAVTLYQRESVSAYLTDSHGSTFTSNVLTLLAEARALTAVQRPSWVVPARKAATGTTTRSK